MANNVCPFCGGTTELYDVEWCGNSWAGFVRCTKNSSHQIFVTLPKAYHAGSSDAEIRQAMFHAFCHPAHLTAGMVIVERWVAVDALEMLENPPSGETFGYHDNFRLPVVESLTAAIDAAKGE